MISFTPKDMLPYLQYHTYSLDSEPSWCSHDHPTSFPSCSWQSSTFPPVRCFCSLPHRSRQPARRDWSARRGCNLQRRIASASGLWWILHGGRYRSCTAENLGIPAKNQLNIITRIKKGFFGTMNYGLSYSAYMSLSSYASNMNIGNRINRDWLFGMQQSLFSWFINKA